jgi:hypothetical protein
MLAQCGRALSWINTTPDAEQQENNGYSFKEPKRSVAGGLYAPGDNNNKGSLL